MSEFEIIETAVGPARLKRTRRKTLAISVLPDGAVELVAPVRASEQAIQAKVIKRKMWIRRQQRAFAEMNKHRASRRYVSGATHRYLGRQYRLKVRKGAQSEVKLLGGYFEVITSKGSEAEVESLLVGWMREKAQEQFTRRLKKWEPWCTRNKLPAPRLSLLSMSKRWGSGGKSGRIALNPELVRAPSACIDYVITHEICHLKHPNHGREFFRLLDVLFPGWPKMKQRLEQAEL